MEIHHGWTFWFQNKRTNKLGANVSPIINHMFVIFQIFSQMLITIEANLKLILLFNLRNLGLLDALKAKLFTN